MRGPRPARVGRREVLRGLGALGGLLLAPGCFTGGEELDTDDGDLPECALTEVGDTKLPPGNWLRGARVGGLATYSDATLCELRPALDQLADERVSVVEVDPDLSSYLDDAGFAEQLRIIDIVGRECHARNMRCIAYWPILESLTVDAANVPHSMAKDHPDWLQTNIDGTPNMFIGNGQVFWVEDGVESAWLCPTSGYVDYFLERLTRLARTSVDGLWGDVPLFSDIVGVWPCTNGTCNQRFKEMTGLDAPTAVDWQNPAFARWVKFRHQALWELEQRLVTTAKSVRPDFEVIIETVTMDYSGATKQGLDGSIADDGLVQRVWEVDVVSDEAAMREAMGDDWISLAVMMKHARGASEPRPTWAFCYGESEDDAERVIAVCVGMGVSPYETKIPEMNGTVGSPFRKRLYSWLADHPQILASNRSADVAVLYSSTSRDIVDQAKGMGLYASMNPEDGDWWSPKPEDSVKELDYLGDYRGMCKLLFQRHVLFDIVTTPHADAATLARNRVVFVPSAASLDEALVERLRLYAEAGGTLVVTGPDAGRADEECGPRASPMLLDALGVDPTVTGWTTKAWGAGKVLFNPDRAGRTFMQTDDLTALASLTSALPQIVTTDAPRGVLFERRIADGGELVLACVNLEGLGTVLNTFTPLDVTFSCAIDVGGRAVKRVLLTRPDLGVGDVEPPFVVEANAIRFSVSVAAIAVAIIEFA